MRWVLACRLHIDVAGAWVICRHTLVSAQGNRRFEMRFISKSVVAGVATMSVLALGASSASATITPTTGVLTATNTGNVSLNGPVVDTCTTVDFQGDINMDNAANAGGGGIITGWTTSGCTINPTGNFSTPWTVNINNKISATTWSGTVTNVNVTISICNFTGSLPLHYNNTTGIMTISGGSLSGCFSTATVTGSWDVRGAGGAIPAAS
jgi:hypothetical protein